MLINIFISLFRQEGVLKRKFESTGRLPERSQPQPQLQCQSGVNREGDDDAYDDDEADDKPAQNQTELKVQEAALELTTKIHFST